MEFIGTLMLRDKVEITDPCYDRGTWCQLRENCEPGEYFGFVEISDEGEWGKRVASISIYKDDNKCSLDNMECIGTIGVDAGVAGFFRDKPDFHGDEWHQFMIDAGMFKANGVYDYDKKFYRVAYGLFSDSGYGDGGYNVYANKDRTAFTIVFIEDESSEDE